MSYEEPERPIIVFPSHTLVFMLFLMLGVLLLLFPLTVWGAFTLLLKSVGWDPASGVVISLGILVFSILLSPVNIPVWSVKRSIYLPTVDVVVVFGIPYTIPRIRRAVRRMTIAVNVGGALIPLAISLYLMGKIIASGMNWLHVVSGIALVTTFTYAASKVVPGVGIVTPALLPPVVSASISVLLAGGSVGAVPLSYTVGTIGTLLGADVLRLWRDWRRINAPMVSIGGAGTFDGIYLTGVFSVALVILLM